jgi:hypothetical protein
VFEVERLDDAAQEPRAAQNLELRIEVGGIVDRAADDDRAGLRGAERGVILQIHLHARLRLVDVGLAGHVDGGQHRPDEGDAEDHRAILAHRAPVVAQVHLALGLFFGDDGRRVREPLVGFFEAADVCDVLD